MQKHHATLASYQFKRAKAEGMIHVLNEGSYLMAEYNERTGVVSWQRVVLATQKEIIERRLREHYPVQHPPKIVVAAAPVKKKVKAAVRRGR